MTKLQWKYIGTTPNCPNDYLKLEYLDFARAHYVPDKVEKRLLVFNICRHSPHHNTAFSGIIFLSTTSYTRWVTTHFQILTNAISKCDCKDSLESSNVCHGKYYVVGWWCGGIGPVVEKSWSLDRMVMNGHDAWWLKVCISKENIDTHANFLLMKVDWGHHRVVLQL